MTWCGTIQPNITVENKVRAGERAFCATQQIPEGQWGSRPSSSGQLGDKWHDCKSRRSISRRPVSESDKTRWRTKFLSQSPPLLPLPCCSIWPHHLHVSSPLSDLTFFSCFQGPASSGYSLVFVIWRSCWTKVPSTFSWSPEQLQHSAARLWIFNWKKAAGGHCAFVVTTFSLPTGILVYVCVTSGLCLGSVVKWSTFNDAFQLQMSRKGKQGDIVVYAASSHRKH